MKRSLIIQSLCLSALMAFSLIGFAQSPGEYVPCQEMPNLMLNYQADYRAIVRFYSPMVTGNGRGGGGGGGGRGGANGAAVDGIGSPERREKLHDLYTEYLGKLEKLNFKSLSQECKVDYVLFKRDMNEKLRTSGAEGAEYDKIKSWLPFSPAIYATEKLRSRGHQLDAEKLAKQYSDMTKQIKELEAKVRDEKNLTQDDIDEAVGSIAVLKLSLESVYEFYNGFEPMFTWWIPMPYKALEDELTAYSGAFKSKSPPVKRDKSGIAGIAVGRDELVRQLQFEMVPYTPEELIDIANKEFAWCDKEMLKASKEMGFGNDWKAALEKVKNSYVPAGQQPEAMLKLYNESVDFLKKHDLVTIPKLAEETWGMEMMSPERQLVNPFFTGGVNLSISYPTNTMTEDERIESMRGNNPHFSRATVHHELIAGHNLEYFSQQRYRTYRDYPSGFWTEGWSLYWELELWDKKFPQSPEDRVGMLFWHMHRCARIIFSLNYHLGKWTPQQCIDFLVDRVGHERANAEGEVRRSFVGHYAPLYQLAYLTGGRQLYALRQLLVDKEHKMTDKQYNDAIMHLNAMPIEMIKVILTNQSIDKDYKANWRFYNDIDLSKSDW